MNATRLFPLLGALVLIGLDVSKAGAQEQPADDSGKVRIEKSFPDPHPARQDIVVFKYAETSDAKAAQNYVNRLVGLLGDTINIRHGAMFKTPAPGFERITIEGGKVEITGDTIKIDRGKVEITRPSRR